MTDYTFGLFPEDEEPLGPWHWPNIDIGGIAMYKSDGQGTQYVWYLSEPLVGKAKKILFDAYETAGETKKNELDGWVKEYHGSWE